MKKHRYSFLFLLFLAAVIMTACRFNASSGEIIKNGSQAGVGDSDSSITNSGGEQNANENLELVNSDSKEENSANENTGAGISGSDVQEVEAELPQIPSVQLGSGDAWFRPTRPSDIQLASGRIQLFEFSAVW